MNEPHSEAAGYRSFGEEIDCMRDRMPQRLVVGMPKQSWRACDPPPNQLLVEILLVLALLVAAYQEKGFRQGVPLGLREPERETIRDTPPLRQRST